MCEVAKNLGLEYKKELMTLKDWETFRDFYSNLTTNEEWLYEGVVIEDKNGFMVKQKSPYYNQWKKLRAVADNTFKCGYIRKTSMLTTPLENLFYAFCKELYANKYEGKKDIITLRNLFLNR